ncbi:prokaryotic molybdopterin-containing oxidoreductase family, membrane subunit [Filimonas lacunae]|uniref:Prokaryotic molybdopterin-containing oxidoreductase family, membrane subunit n=1 Tax=Filimonas lacunae TaxID=477680 RepID=A0A173ME16_9BACT|nr:NrfD/PsrC family molybdoenzyme membrane anchor subunit [Filimonas lacunae]BAV05842.1 molybdopterin oxidoreductase [Filimonas lacunae]SIT28407.1 prokaryotic molybdopterin-containing oxidoreductase family, membrane subunit [Filimonas lacunae]
MENELTVTEEQKIIADLLPRPFGRAGKIWVAALSVVCLLGVFAYYRQLRYGLQVTAMRDYVSWGLYISNFVFFVAISLVGSLITAILRIANVTWSTPLTRIAEMIAIAAIMFAAMIIVIDMGRPERLLNVFAHGRIQSPIIWDVVVITTYFFVSLLLLYLPLLPDIQILRAHQVAAVKPFQKLYKFMGAFWKKTPEQHRISSKAISILCITIIPVAFCIHTVTSWLFATTFRPGWDSTNFGAYFISGAFLAGSGAVVVAMFVVRKAYQLDKYITDVHFDKMGRILVLLALLYLYFNVNEYLVPAFKMKEGEGAHLNQLFRGDWALKFWTTILVSMVIPIVMLVFKKGRKPLPMFIAGLMVVAGAWFKRYIIVVPSMLHPFLPMHDVPASYKYYFPSWEEWAIAGGSLAGALLVITLLVRIFPVIPIRETIDEMKTD